MEICSIAASRNARTHVTLLWSSQSQRRPLAVLLMVAAAATRSTALLEATVPSTPSADAETGGQTRVLGNEGVVL